MKSIKLHYTDLEIDPTELRVAYQGSVGSFSESALTKYFGEEVIKTPFEVFSHAYNAVRTGECDFGILPIENTLIGTIHLSFDVLSTNHELVIVGDELLQIEHALIGLADTDLDKVTAVYSQPPGLEQCSDFLDAYKYWERVPFKDTAAAVAHVASQNNPTCVAIASERAAKIYNLQILKKNIENNNHNFTRFAIITNKHTPIYESIKNYKQEHNVSPNVGIIVFSTEDKPGALLHCLQVFDKYSLNLHKIESRPIIGKPWEYQFTVEVEIQDKSIQEASANLQALAKTFHTVGIYTRYATEPI